MIPYFRLDRLSNALQTNQTTEPVMKNNERMDILTNLQPNTPEIKKRFQEETLRLHGTDPAELEKKIFEHTKDFSAGDCWTQSHPLLREVWDTFPQCPVEFTVRNFTLLSRGPTVTVFVKGLGWGRAYNHNVPLTAFCPELAELLEGDLRKDSIPHSDFIKHGQRIADLLKRPFRLMHQEGGDPGTAGYTPYSFFPNEKPEEEAVAA